MDELLLTLGFLLQAFYFTLFVIYIRNRWVRHKRERDKEIKKLLVTLADELIEEENDIIVTGATAQTIVRSNHNIYGWPDDNRNNPMPLRERYGGILEEKEDFIPKKKMKYHTLEEPIFFGHSENEAEGCGCDTACNCYDTTFYDTTIYDL